MRDFFIIGMEYIIHVAVILMILALFLGTAMVALSIWTLPVALPGGVGATGIMASIVFFFFGGVQLFLVAGVLYLFLGIYQNTRRMAQALEHRMLG